MGRTMSKIRYFLILLLMGVFIGCGNVAGTDEVSDPTAAVGPAATETQEGTENPEVTKVPKVTETPKVTKAPEAMDSPDPTKRPVPPRGELTGCTAQELTEMMTIGWNLGNTLESTGEQVTFDSEPKKAVTAWGNEEPTKELFEAVKAAGFDTVRIPITWYQHMKYDAEEGHYVINEKWLEYVKNTVDYAYELDMFVIINVHHEDWVNAPMFTEESYAVAEQMLTEVWSSAADIFEDYDQHLIFESMNEPRQTGLGSTVEWGTGDAKSRKYINDLNQVMVNVVRGQGSAANKERLIMLPGYAASNNTETLNSIAIPENGGNIAISVHAYYPYFFAADTSDKANHEFPGKSGYGENYETAINSLFSKLKTVSEGKEVPLIMGECGASDFNNTESRVRWATYFLTKAKEAGIVCAFWDNQAIYNGTGEAYGLLCRKDYTWFENSAPVVEAIMKVYGKDIKLPVHVTAAQKEFDWADIPMTEEWVEIYRSEHGEELAAWGNTWLENWKPYLAPEYDIILVYQSDSEPYMVLQGGWHKVYSEEGEKHPYMRRFTFNDVTETMNLEGVKLTDMTGYFASASQSTMKLYGVYAVPVASNAAPEDAEENEKEEGEITVIPTEENVRTIGRTEMLKDTLWMALSGSGAEFSVTGTKASVTMKADGSAKGDENNRTRVAVYVDGVRVADEMLSKAETEISVFESETEETHTVRVIKLSESAMSTCGLSEITVKGQVSPTKPKEKFIEFVGDSITCGYGVDDEDKDHHFSTKTEDVTKGYAYKTAANLNADYSMVSFSGYGIISGYTGTGEKSGEQLVPMYYEKLGFSYGTYLGSGSPQNVSWDFAKRQPDLVVINLGTNDNSYVLGDAERTDEYVKGYVEFLKNVRKCNPEAKILCTLGIMGTDLCPAVETAVAEYSRETGDENVSSMRFNEQLPSDGLAADWHPTEATHTKAATKLTAEIKSVMGW